MALIMSSPAIVSIVTLAEVASLTVKGRVALAVKLLPASSVPVTEAVTLPSANVPTAAAGTVTL
ncbi:Uncharacterised protein [Zhongshania aliphaticivorans]|uniref:Uncharacterized protein n=1 Tax=Zhongshania aliphaticivorans TaxID=1470434 RepID=A0A5S9PRE7_9GAMM|nr:Uncharacterised protein [Zhongshania aliphaticivorans]CAA0107341.1 Uncharacterised protein [Zhongshania aliphaticivorans]